MKFFYIAFLLFISVSVDAQPTLSFTFDDGITADRPGYTFEKWNQLILNHLAEANVKAVFFVTGKNKRDEKGKFLLENWNNAGHKIANHTYSHPYLNSEKITAQQFTSEILQTDSIISQYDNYVKLFRFPYLKEGNTPEKVDSVRVFLKAQGYKNGYVTIDASDWYIDSQLIKSLRNNSKTDIEAYKKYYLNHLYERAMYYDSIALELTEKPIKHTLLLHHNLAAALFLGDAIKMFKEKGWKIIDSEEAYTDPIFDKTPRWAGESLIWALAKDTGKYTHVLRYPAESKDYEKPKMDALGL